jgi:hypothetical protein
MYERFSGDDLVILMVKSVNWLRLIMDMVIMVIEFEDW